MSWRWACEQCGSGLVRGKRRRAKTCSDKCAAARKARKQAERRADARAKKGKR